jgi:hypothetical protein
MSIRWICGNPPDGMYPEYPTAEERRQWIVDNPDFVAGVAEGLRQCEAGETVDYEEFRAQVLKHLAELRK